LKARTLRRWPFVASLLVLAVAFSAQAADLFVSGVDSANIVRFDGKTGKRVRASAATLVHDPRDRAGGRSFLSEQLMVR
jgi:hypothetical protein